MSVIGNGTRYETFDDFLRSLGLLKPSVQRYMARYRRVPRKFWERGGRRHAR